MKKLIVLLSLVLLLSSCTTSPTVTEDSPILQEETTSETTSSEVVSTEETSSPKLNSTLITLGETIQIDGNDLSEDRSSPVYLQTIVETHPDVSPDLEGTSYQAVTIQESGSYEFVGELENSQIRIDAPDQDNINIVLNGVTITNPTAPGIYVVDALDKDTPGEGSVTITLAPNSENNVRASHIGKYFLDPEETQKIKNDGAISANVSLIIDGTGYLKVTADKEGIEVKNHLTINGGHLDIDAMDDSINASEDDVSHITINDGTIYAKSILGSEGDGIDSNGYITINGGNIIAVGHPKSMDSGLDSDLGITINGGTIAATGNMYDEILSSSNQQFIHLTFSNTQPESTLVVVTDENDNPVFAYESLVSFSNITMSDNDFSDGNFKIYLGGEIEGTVIDGLYTDITSYTLGALQQYTGTGGGRFGGGGGPGGGRPPEGETPPEKPQGMEPSEEMQPQETSGETSSVFALSSETHVFRGVSSAVN